MKDSEFLARVRQAIRQANMNGFVGTAEALAELEAAAKADTLRAVRSAGKSASMLSALRDVNKAYKTRRSRRTVLCIGGTRSQSIPAA